MSSFLFFAACSEPDTAQLITRRAVVESQVRALFPRFLDCKRTELGEAAFDHLSGIDIYAVPNELRPVIVGLLNAPGFDSAAYWGMIDAVGALADSHRGRWPLMGVQERDAVLEHALVFVAQVESGVTGPAAADDDVGAVPSGLDRNR